MNRSVSLIVLALAGCGPTMHALSSDGAARDPLQALEDETGHSWTVRWQPDIHTPAFLEGRTAPMATTADDAARTGRDFIQRHGALFSMGDTDDLVVTAADTDELGMSHARFREEVQGHPVWGGELVTHFGADGALLVINGRYIPVASDLGQAAKSADEARVLAVDAARQANPALSPDAFTTYAPKLYAYPVDAQTVKLAWRVQMDVVDDTTDSVYETFVDAGDGSVLHTVELTQYLDGSGVGVFGDSQKLVVAPNGASYILEDATRGMPPTRTYSAGARVRLPGTAVRSKDAAHWDEAGDAHGAAVDAHAFVAVAWDYFASVHGRAGWDDKGKGIHTTVHFGRSYANAFFNGKQLAFGDGDGTSYAPLSGALDVVAHEYTHGVTFHSAHLGVEGQNGALNEAISDIFGCFIAGTWTIGAAVYHPLGRHHAIRDVAQPHGSNNPATMAEYVGTSDDNGGVHVNSTIVSHAAYAMTTGAHALPRLTVEKIWYRALTRYLHARADFADAADATVASARDLGGDAETTVREAWVAAGVLQ